MKGQKNKSYAITKYITHVFLQRKYISKEKNNSGKIDQVSTRLCAQNTIFKNETASFLKTRKVIKAKT
jgi:hypothetical protein